MNNILSPLRYPGGKGKLAQFILNIAQYNNLLGGDYYEAYAGGSAVALNMLLNGVAKNIHINDIDDLIYDFWHSVTTNPEQFIALLHNSPVTMESRQHWSNVLLHKKEYSQLERGFAVFFINRTSWSGILKAGVLGGKKQNSLYKIDSRFNKKSLVSRIKLIARHSHQIHIYNENALTFLQRIKAISGQKSLIYLDPPYYDKGQYLYQNYYDHRDHLDIARLLKVDLVDKNWILTYDNTKKIRDMYENYQIYTYSLNYSAHRSYVGSEIMLFSKELNINRKWFNGKLSNLYFGARND